MPSNLPEPIDSAIEFNSQVPVSSDLDVKPLKFEITTNAISPSQPMEMSMLYSRPEPTGLLADAKMSADQNASDISELRYADGIAAAADVVTTAIGCEIKRDDTLVVWLLDESISLKQNHEMLAEKAVEFHKSMDTFHTSRNDYSDCHTLMSSVATFGKRWGEILRPTRMGSKAVEAMTRLPSDRVSKT